MYYRCNIILTLRSAIISSGTKTFPVCELTSSSSLDLLRLLTSRCFLFTPILRPCILLVLTVNVRFIVLVYIEGIGLILKEKDPTCESCIDDPLAENTYRADEFLPPLLPSQHFSPMLIAFWVMRDLPHQLLLQTDHLVFERLNICKSECELESNN